MLEPQPPATTGLGDPARLEALRRTDLLDSPAEEVFDRYTRLLSRVVGAPVALLSLVDDTRQFFKSAVGLGEPWASARGTDLTRSFCQHVVSDDAVLRVTDARHDPRVRDSAAVEDLGVVAYLGTPVHAPDGQPVGSLCVIDAAPRAWTDDDLELLTELAGVTSDLIALRAAAAERRAAALELSHSLRSGLTGLRLEVEQAVQDLPEGDARATVQHVAEALAEQTAALDGALGRLGQVGAEPVRDVDVADLLVQVAAQAGGRPGGVVVEPAEPVGGPPVVHVAEAALRRVLLDLVALVGRHGSGPVRLRAEAGASAVRVRVQADGPGLPPEVAQALTARSDGGRLPTGSVAESAARLLGGRLLVLSGPGTSVALVLPPRRP